MALAWHDRSQNRRDLIAVGAFLLAATGLIPAQAQQADRAPAQPQSSPAAADDQDARMRIFQARAKARWRAQQIVARKAEADYHKARLDREIAEIKQLEYQESELPQDLDSVDAEVMLAESDLSRAEDRSQWARRMFAKGFVALSVKVSEELALKKARFTLEQAQTKKRVMVEFSKGKSIKELKRAIEKARTEELARKADWELEKSRERELEQKVVKLKPSGTTAE